MTFEDLRCTHYDFCFIRNCFSPDSDFLRQLLFFFNACNSGDFVLLVEACRFIRYFVQANGEYKKKKNIFLAIFKIDVGLSSDKFLNLKFYGSCLLRFFFSSQDGSVD